MKVGINFYPERRTLSYWKAEGQASSSFPLPIHNPPKCHKDTWNTHQIPKNLSNPLLFALKSEKKRCASIAISEKLPTFALAFRKGAHNEIFERLRTRRKRQGSAAFREQPSDVNSYRNNKRIKQESLAGQTRASGARTHIYNKYKWVTSVVASQKRQFITVKSLILAQDER